MKPIVIVGAGITGCVIARELAKKGCQVILVEKENSVGGLARTYCYGDFSFDVGPHRFFSQKPQIMAFIKSVLKDDYTTMDRDSEVYFAGKYYPWPLRPAVLFNFPLITTLRSVWDLILMIGRDKKIKPDNFEDYILINYGPSLYNIFFKDYTQKFLGLAPKKIHSEWAREGMKRTIIDERVVSRNLMDILRSFFIFNPPKTEFIYPLEGVGLFCDRMKDEVKKLGGEILTSSAVTRIERSFEKIEEVFLQGRLIKPEAVVWTAPLGEVCNLLKLPSKGLEYLSLLLFNIEMAGPVNRSYQWCYYGSYDVIFSRVSITSSFSKNMVPEHKTGLCVEITCRQGDKYWNNPELLVERVRNDLVKVGMVNQIKDIGVIHTEKVADAYPVYAIDYQEDVKKVKEDLCKICNLKLAGRTGLFWYNNMDDCIENGIETAANVLSGKEVLKKAEI